MVGREKQNLEHVRTLSLQVEYIIELLGFALEYGADQLPNQKLYNLGESRTLWVALQWHTAPELAIDCGISLRLHDSDGVRVFQRDVVLWKPHHTYTGNKGPSELFDTLTKVRSPADFPEGDYELRLIVYDAETLKPTVELGVWEPEVALARLRPESDQESLIPDSDCKKISW